MLYFRLLGVIVLVFPKKISKYILNIVVCIVQNFEFVNNYVVLNEVSDLKTKFFMGDFKGL